MFFKIRCHSCHYAIPAIMSLLNDLNENIITSDDVSEQLEHMTKREKILNRQKSFCGIWLASDGRYKTKVPTGDGGKKLIAKPTQENPMRMEPLRFVRRKLRHITRMMILFFWIKPEKEFMTMLSTMLSAD